MSRAKTSEPRAAECPSRRRVSGTVGCTCTGRCCASGSSRSRSTSSTRPRRCPAWRTSTAAKRRSRSASARRCAATTTSPAPIAAMGTAWPRAPRSTACSPSCSARSRATAAARAARCTSPIRRPATSAPTPSSAAAPASPPARRSRQDARAATRSRSASSATARWARASSTRSMNMAALWKLPVIYVCENNLYSEYTHVQRDRRRRHLARAPRPSASTPRRVDGQDVRAVNATAQRLVERARRGEGPASCLQHLPLLRPPRRRRQARVLPLQGGRERLDDRARPDPDARATGSPSRASPMRTRLRAIHAEVQAEIDAGVQFALNAPFPDASEVDQHVYA